jgi:1-acyl-sn-glycerol-3-phosphate acyltransferase
MNEILARLDELFKLKHSFSYRKDSIIKEQLNLLKKLESQSSLEEHVSNSIISKIISAEKFKEYSISPQEFSKIVKERDVTKNMIFIFKEEVAEISRQFSLLSGILMKQQGTFNIALLLAEEEKVYAALQVEMGKILASEKVLKQYFSDISKLTYHKDWLRATKVISKIIAGMKFTIRVDGLQNIPKSGPCILAPHHVHWLYDESALFAVVPRHMFAPTAVEVYHTSLFGQFFKNPLTDLFLKKVGSMPIKKDDSLFPPRLKTAVPAEKIATFNCSNTTSLNKALMHLKYGDAILLFPEGDSAIGTSFDRGKYEFLPPQEGMTMLAYLCMRKFSIETPIVPIGIKYSGKFIWIRIGTPVLLNPAIRSLSGQNLKEALKEHTTGIFNMIVKLSS